MKLTVPSHPYHVHLVWALLTALSFVISSQWAQHSRVLESHDMASNPIRAISDQPGHLRAPGGIETAENAETAEETGFRFASSSDSGQAHTRDFGEVDLAPMTNDELDSLVRNSIKATNQLERRHAFDRILDQIQSSEFTVEQAMVLRRSMAEYGASGEQWRLFDYAWGASQPEAAIAYLDEIPSKYHDAFLGNMIPGLASENPRDAIGLFQSLDQALQGKIRARLLEGLVDHDVALATDFLYQSSDPNNHDWRPMDTLAREIERDRGLDTTLEWAADLPEGALRSNAWSAAYAVWATEDPHGAVQSIIDMPESGDRNQAINGFISAYAHQDGERATVWAAEITSPGMREAAMIRAGRQFYAQDQQAAAQWFASSGLPETAWAQLTDPNK